MKKIYILSIVSMLIVTGFFTFSVTSKKIEAEENETDFNLNSNPSEPELSISCESTITIKWQSNNGDPSHGRGDLVIYNVGDRGSTLNWEASATVTQGTISLNPASGSLYFDPDATQAPCKKISITVNHPFEKRGDSFSGEIFVTSNGGEESRSIVVCFEISKSKAKYDNNPPDIEWWGYQGSPVKGIEYDIAFRADFIDTDHDDCRVVAQIKDQSGRVIDTVKSSWDIYHGSGKIPYTYNQAVGTTLDIEVWVEDEHGAESSHGTGSVTVRKNNAKEKLCSQEFLLRLFDRFPLFKQLFLNLEFFNKL